MKDLILKAFEKISDIIKSIIDAIKEKRWFIFSLSLAGMVAMWDIKYAQKNFKGDSILIMVMMFQIHLSYILLPYFNNEVKTDKFSFKNIFTFYKAMRTVFFIAALLPASLQINSQILDRMNAKVKTKPVLPAMPTLSTNIDKEIDREVFYKWQAQNDKDLTKDKREEKIEKIQVRLDKMQTQKDQYRDAIVQYNVDVAEYPQKVKEYEEYIAQHDNTKVFDYLNLLFPFFAIVAIQIMNMQTSKRAAEEREEEKQPEIKIPVKFSDIEKKTIKQMTNYAKTPPVESESLRKMQEASNALLSIGIKAEEDFDDGDLVEIDEGNGTISKIQAQKNPPEPVTPPPEGLSFDDITKRSEQSRV